MLEDEANDLLRRGTHDMILPAGRARDMQAEVKRLTVGYGDVHATPRGTSVCSKLEQPPPCQRKPYQHKARVRQKSTRSPRVPNPTHAIYGSTPHDSKTYMHAIPVAAGTMAPPKNKRNQTKAIMAAKSRTNMTGMAQPTAKTLPLDWRLVNASGDKCKRRRIDLFGSSNCATDGCSTHVSFYGQHYYDPIF